MHGLNLADALSLADNLRGRKLYDISVLLYHKFSEANDKIDDRKLIVERHLRKYSENQSI